MPLDPLSPQQVDALLKPDPRTRTADLLVLRDALQRMGGALERLHGAVSQLQRAAGELERETRALDRQVNGPKSERAD
jgi:hypothetical protein